MEVYFFGHHKCGSTWVRKILEQASQILSLQFDYLHSSSSFVERGGRSAGKRSRIVAYANADVDFIPEIRELRGFHVVRDPRDLIVSGYFSHLYSHPLTDELSTLRETLASMDFEQGLMEEMRFDASFIDHIAKWQYDYPGVTEYKYEELVKNPYGSFINIFEHLGLVEETTALVYLSNEIKRKVCAKLGVKYRSKLEKLPYQLLVSIIEDNQFKNLSGGRKPGAEDVKSHFRKGVAGDWKEYFSDAHKAFFKDNYGDLLIRLGYEKDNDW